MKESAARLAVIGRTDMLLGAALMAHKQGHHIVYVATAKESSESGAAVKDFYELSKMCGCPFFLGNRFDSNQLEIISGLNLDLGITMNWPTMISEPIVKSFKHGIINAHGSDLPKYRGNACPNWAIINGEKNVGLSFHMIDPLGLDTGPIIHKEYLEINDETYIGDIYEWLYSNAPEGFLKSIEKLISGSPLKAQNGEVIRAYPRKPEDGRIVWNYDSDSIHRLIRASSRPFPGAFCFFLDRRVTIWRASKIILDVKILAIPGQVLWYNCENPVIACGSGAIELTDFSVDGEPIGKSLRARFS
jgi:methionyl-tRNA formyltransferase